MEQMMNINTNFIWASAITGGISILLIWMYVKEASKGIIITEYKVYGKYVNLPFNFAWISLVVMWLTSVDTDRMIYTCYLGLTIAWIVTLLGIAIYSVIIDTNTYNKSLMRETIKPCVKKIIVLVVAFWLFY